MRDRKEDSMSHVDEGTLHAYLDGELPSSERAALEEHLAQCTTCRAALADERALRERASALLGSARPIERSAPPLEQLRRSAQARRSPWYVRRSFAWAASIALALGAGYLLRSPTGEVAAPGSQQPSSVGPTIVATTRAPTAPPPEQKPTAPAQRRTTPRVPRVPAELGRASEKAAPPADVVAAALPSREASNAAPAPDSVAQQRLKDTRLEAVVVRGSAAPARPEASVFVDGATVQPVTAKSWAVIDRRLAKSLLGQEPVGIPALAVRSFRRGPGRDGTIVVEQALDSATVIQIFQRPASTSLNDAAERQRADHFGRFIGRLRVEIAGPVSADSLNRLLEQVEPLP